MLCVCVQGEAVATKLDSKGRRVEVQVYRPGDFFGERALLANERRAATVTARGTAMPVHVS